MEEQEEAAAVVDVATLTLAMTPGRDAEQQQQQEEEDVEEEGDATCRERAQQEMERSSAGGAAGAVNHGFDESPDSSFPSSPERNNDQQALRPADPHKEPRDPCNFIYLSMVLAGTGFLLPYNCFTVDVDYLHSAYPDSTIVFDINTTYLVTSLCTVLLVSLLVERVDMHTRITAGYVLALLPLLFVGLCEVWFGLIPHHASYQLHLLSVAVVAFASTGLAGVVASTTRVVTRASVGDVRTNTGIFFAAVAAMEVVCLLCHQLVRRSRFVHHHTGAARGGGRRPAPPSKPESFPERGTAAPYVARHSVAGEEVTFENEVTQKDDSPVWDGLNHVGEEGGVYVRMDPPMQSDGALKKMFGSRLAVSRLLWPYMSAIAITYLISLTVYPGLLSEVRSCELGEWMPIMLMALFNYADLLGKILAAAPVPWKPLWLVLGSLSRLPLIPLLVLCTAPLGAPVLPPPAWPCALSILLGITNGYMCSVPMIRAPGAVPPERRELAGNIMTVSLMMGLTAGSLIAYSFSGQVRAPDVPCGALNSTLVSSTLGGSSRGIATSTAPSVLVERTLL
ncbi:equilibrative nucleoside transporter 4 isoform X2 [Petromyzon marinus]|uniref:equilibrative nucleoside transporter 4 isoform X2 n=1 Tax=Petromyzon marinus TaxID=7757 RepID=UPI003F6F5DF3